MTGLQETFYIMAIIFMSLTFLILIALVSAVFVIRSKVNKIHENIEEKINQLSSLAERGGELSALASTAVLKQAKKVFSKAKK
jgi:F0F1-type ATP synthase membrane subunit b/b'